MTRIAKLSPDKLRERFGFALRAAINRGDRTAVEIADFADVCEGTVDEWRAGRSLPAATTVVGLICFVGPAFGTDLFGPYGMALVEADPDNAPGEHRRTATMLAETLVELCRAVEDGYVDHQERARIWGRVGPLLPRLLAYAPRELRGGMKAPGGGADAPGKERRPRFAVVGAGRTAAK